MEVPEKFSCILQVSSNLICFRQRKAYQGTNLLLRPVANLVDLGSIISSLDSSTCQSHEHRSHIIGSIESERMRRKEHWKLVVGL